MLTEKELTQYKSDVLKLQKLLQRMKSERYYSEGVVGLASRKLEKIRKALEENKPKGKDYN